MGGSNAGILYEVQEKEGDKEPSPGYAKEPQARNSRCVSSVRNQGIPNWQRNTTWTRVQHTEGAEITSRQLRCTLSQLTAALSLRQRDI